MLEALITINPLMDNHPDCKEIITEILQELMNDDNRDVAEQAIESENTILLNRKKFVSKELNKSNNKKHLF